MLQIKCTAENTVTIQQLTPFQGDLKKRSEQELKDLTKSLIEDGLLMPFAVWQKGDVNYILDGHGRVAAIQSMVEVDPEVLTQEFPCIYIKADTENDARKALLQITSSYGHITKKGAVKFTASIPEYKAPSINRFVHGTVKRRASVTEQPKTEQRITLLVPVDKADEVKKLLASVSYIKVLN